MNLFRPISALLAVSLGLAAAISLRAEPADGIMAIVNDQAITFEQVNDFAAPAIQSLHREYPDSSSPEYQRKLAQTVQDSLDQLIERQLILHSFAADGYVPLPDTLVDQIVQDRIRERFGNRVTLMKTLQAEGMTLEEFRKQARDQYIETAMRNVNIYKEIVVSPYKIQNYYEAHQDDYRQEDQVKLRMIVLKKTGDGDTDTARMAREIQNKIRHGADFAQMAAVYSQGSQQHQGGDWGWVEHSVLRQDLAGTAFSLPVGQVSDVIDTPDSCYLMMVEGKKAAQVRPLTEVRGDIEKALKSQEQARIEKNWIDGLKKKNFIRYFNNDRVQY